MYAKPIRDLITAFTRLPSVGPRTAERFVFYLLKSGKKEVAELTLALKTLIESVKSCELCWDFSDRSPCHICADKKRDMALICVVSEPQELQAIEHTGQYTGLYHVLRGVLDASDEESVRGLKIRELVLRVKDPAVREVILAFSPDVHGETTMLWLEKELHRVRPDLTISRLAKGLPTGSDLQYADKMTLGSALKNRQSSLS